VIPPPHQSTTSRIDKPRSMPFQAEAATRVPEARLIGATWKPAQAADFCLRREMTSSHAVVTQGQMEAPLNEQNP
jgi:hypothetical protein